MGSPDEKEKHRHRRKSKIAKDLRTPKYRQRRVDSDYNKKKINELTHLEFVELLNAKQGKLED